MPFLCLGSRKSGARVLGTSAHVSLFDTTVNTKLRHYRVVELLRELKFTFIHGVILKLIAMCIATNNALLRHNDVFKWNKCNIIFQHPVALEVSLIVFFRLQCYDINIDYDNNPRLKCSLKCFKCL
jgi:hypothetical protein